MANLREQILTHLDPDEAVSLCTRLIQHPSENPPAEPGGDMREMANFIITYLEGHGLTVQTYEPRPGWPIIVSTIQGEKPTPHLVLNGHMDVVPAGDRSRWEFDPYGGEMRDGYILGRGTSDMKGGLAGIIHAFVAASKGGPLPGTLSLVVVPDEETGGHDGTKWIVENGILQGDACLIAEPSRESPTIGQKGACWLKVTTFGTPGHGSLSPVAGKNAIVEMTKALEAVYTVWERDWELPDEIQELLEFSKAQIREMKRETGIERVLDHVSVNVGVIHGGDKVNKIPDRCEAEIDMRLPFGVSSEFVLNVIKEALAARGVEAKVESLHWQSEANYTLPDSPLVKTLCTVAGEITGKEVRPSLQWASSDARYFRMAGIPTAQYGPAELEGIHSFNERVTVDELKMVTRIYALTIADYLNDN